MKRFLGWLLFLGCFIAIPFTLFYQYQGVFSVQETYNTEQNIKAEEQARIEEERREEERKRKEEQQRIEEERIRNESEEAEYLALIGEPVFNTKNISMEQFAQQRYYTEFTQSDFKQAVEKMSVVQANSKKILEYHMQSDRRLDMEQKIRSTIPRMLDYIADVEAQSITDKKLNDKQRLYIDSIIRDMRHTAYYATNTITALQESKGRLLSTEESNPIISSYNHSQRNFEQALDKIDAFEKHLAIPSPVLFAEQFLIKEELAIPTEETE